MLLIVLAAILTLGVATDPPGGQLTDEQTPAAQPTSQPGVSTRPRSPTQARILEELLRGTEQHATRPILPDTASRNGEAAADAVEAGRTLLLDGTPIWNRSGRLVRAGDRSEFHFDPGEAEESGPTVMEFNKNALLEAMEAEAQAGVKEFRISAEVTRYRGRNYLILRKYRRQISNGNLTP